jgi:hypothetical protein
LVSLIAPFVLRERVHRGKPPMHKERSVTVNYYGVVLKFDFKKKKQVYTDKTSELLKL